MCGIFALVSSIAVKDLKINGNNGILQLNHRGPDQTKNIIINTKQHKNVYLGFSRLAINDLTENGMQPMTIQNTKTNEDLHLICNGEIYNNKEIIAKFNFQTNSTSDCEVILHLYNYFVHIEQLSINEALAQIYTYLDGEFAFTLYDETFQSISIMRDPLGVRPLFVGKNNSNGDIGFASEMKSLYEICDDIKQLPGGRFCVVEIDNVFFDNKILECDKFIVNDEFMLNKTHEEVILENINILMRKAVRKRVFTSEREVCCLLSGGLDSSLVSALVSSNLPPNTLKTFSIGIKGSPDLKYAKEVSEYIKSIHHSIELTEEDFLNAIEKTIEIIESYDTTSVRASVGNYLVSKYIRENTNCKVVFNGDYSDEVCGGYKYMWNSPSDKIFDEECRSLIKNIIYFDSLRSDRTISSQGLEARVPFSDKTFVNYYLSIPSHLRKPCTERPEKYLLRKAFDNDNILPKNILWRPKEAFSDGVSEQTRSWHMIISEYIDKIISDDEFNENKDKFKINPPKLKETYYYRKVFEKKYGSQNASIIPKYWLPKWCGKLHDPSAREIR